MGDMLHGTPLRSNTFHLFIYSGDLNTTLHAYNSVLNQIRGIYVQPSRRNRHCVRIFKQKRRFVLGIGCFRSCSPCRPCRPSPPFELYPLFLYAYYLSSLPRPVSPFAQILEVLCLQLLLSVLVDDPLLDIRQVGPRKNGPNGNKRASEEENKPLASRARVPSVDAIHCYQRHNTPQLAGGG